MQHGWGLLWWAMLPMGLLFFKFLCLFWTFFFHLSQFREKLQKTRSKLLQFWIESLVCNLWTSILMKCDSMIMGLKICFNMHWLCLQTNDILFNSCSFIIWRLLYVIQYLVPEQYSLVSIIFPLVSDERTSVYVEPDYACWLNYFAC